MPKRNYAYEGSGGGYMIDEIYTCEYCGCEIPDNEVCRVPYNRYISFVACADCAAKELEMNQNTENYEQI